MKSCPFDESRELLVMYHDGIMPRGLEERFSDHLLNCRPCMEALLDLQKDLFSMEHAEFLTVPRQLSALAEEGTGGEQASGLRTLFRFIRGALTLVENPPGAGGFRPHAMPEFLGRLEEDEVRRVYRWDEGELTLSLLQKGEDRFSIVIQGAAGRSLSLLQNGRVVEGHDPVQEDHLIVKDLRCGDYELHVDDEVIVLFRVDQEEVHGSEAGV